MCHLLWTILEADVPFWPTFGYEQKDLLRRGLTPSPQTLWGSNKKKGRLGKHILDVQQKTNRLCYGLSTTPLEIKPYFSGLLTYWFQSIRPYYTLISERGVRLGWFGVGLINHQYRHNHGKFSTRPRSVATCWVLLMLSVPGPKGIGGVRLTLPETNRHSTWITRVGRWGPSFW